MMLRKNLLSVSVNNVLYLSKRKKNSGIISCTNGRSFLYYILTVLILSHFIDDVTEYTVSVLMAQ